jgi:hypothetical protein
MRVLLLMSVYNQKSLWCCLALSAFQYHCYESTRPKGRRKADVCHGNIIYKKELPVNTMVVVTIIALDLVV